VKNQQSRAGIGVDGVVGPKTWGALTGTASTAPSTSQPKLRLGSRGAAVTTLQKQLNASGASLRVDGVFGSATASAVRALQSSARISVDAVVGPNTWSALGKGLSNGSGGTSAPSAPPASVGHPKLRQGDRGAAVKTLQSELNASGARTPATGAWGGGTGRPGRACRPAPGPARTGAARLPGRDSTARGWCTSPPTRRVWTCRARPPRDTCSAVGSSPSPRPGPATSSPSPATTTATWASMWATGRSSTPPARASRSSS